MLEHSSKCSMSLAALIITSGDLLKVGKTKHNFFKNYQQVPVRSVESDNLSKDLKARGFSFVGSAICYAMMQAVGLVNDHTTNCFRHKELLEINDK